VNSPNGEDVHRVYFLSGLAGSGKSAIAHTIAQYFDGIGRLGSSFCFSRANQAQRRPNNLFSTITLDIADLDCQWKTALHNTVRGKRALRSTLSPREQFINFILKPSEALTTVGPVVIVIDALDESGDRATREVLLNVIGNSMHTLPSNFRVLVTSRPEPDIYEALAGKAHVRCKHMDTIDKKENEADISVYIQKQLANMTDLDREWPNQEWCNLLLKNSDGLFQWAFTACSAIKGGRGALRPPERLRRFITSARGLDGLYSEILSQAFDPSDSQDMNRFTSIMGRILAAKEPLSVESLSKLRSDNEQPDIVELILRPLASLLSGVTQTTVAVRPLHASFSDFLTHRERSGQFCVEPAQKHRDLALASFRVMNAKLRFNICKLESSYHKNRDVPDIENRIAKHIPAHLSYACRFWEDHAREMTFDQTAIEILKDFLQEHFLHWLEVLSLIGQLPSASSALESCFKWIKVTFLIIHYNSWRVLMRMVRNIMKNFQIS
jgi:NACHT domain